MIPLSVIIAMAGVLCAIGVAMLGVVWRLGTRTGEMKIKIEQFDEKLQKADESGERWNKQVIDAVRELDQRVVDQNVKIGELENKWKTAHRLVQKVFDLDNRVCGIEAVCRDRIRCENSQPLFAEDGAPNLHDDSEDKT